MQQQPIRRDIGWRRANLLALLVLCLVGSTILLMRLPSRVPIGEQLPVDRQRAAQAAQRIDPNTADEATLRLLPRIGPEMARKIIDYRTSVATTQPFTQPSDLQRVPRIGPATIEQLEPWLTLSTGTQLRASTSRERPSER